VDIRVEIRVSSRESSREAFGLTLDIEPERRPRCAYRPINQLVTEEPEEK